MRAQERMAIKRDVVMAVAAMRVGYSNNRHDRSKMSSQQSNQGSQSVEPGFRVYGKNHAAQEISAMRAQRANRRSKMAEPASLNADFSFRGNPQNELMSRSLVRDAQYD